MPLYDYHCTSCDREFEEALSIANRKDPVNAPCSECGGVVEQLLVGTNIGDPVVLGVKKHSSEFKDVMEKIKRNNPKGAINWSSRDYN